jgi:membrane protein insertase Oxa1/YidC/SpoIIIJ
MGLLKGTIVKLAEVTGSYGTAIIAIVAIVKAITYPLNYQVRPSPSFFSISLPSPPVPPLP